MKALIYEYNRISLGIILFIHFYMILYFDMSQTFATTLSVLQYSDM